MSPNPDSTAPAQKQQHVQLFPHLYPLVAKRDATGAVVLDAHGEPVMIQVEPPPSPAKSAPKPAVAAPVFDHLLATRPVFEADGKTPKLDENGTPITEPIYPEAASKSATIKRTREPNFAHLQPADPTVQREIEKQLADYRAQVHWQLSHTGRLLVIQLSDVYHPILREVAFGRQGRPPRVSDPLLPTHPAIPYFLDRPSEYLVTGAEAITHLPQQAAPVDHTAELEELHQKVAEQATELEAFRSAAEVKAEPPPEEPTKGHGRGRH